MSLILYDYFRSTACYRVRIALNLKALNHELKEVHLVNNGGEQHSPQYKTLNPQALVPTLIDERFPNPLTQSLCIIDYIDETYPDPTLLPTEVNEKYTAKQIALTISSDIHPLNNLRVLKYLKTEHDFNEEMISKWYHHWLKEGFDAIESILSKTERGDAVCVGKTISIADLCLIPQVYNAKRFKFDLNNYPLINQINDYCLTLQPFKDAAP